MVATVSISMCPENEEGISMRKEKISLTGKGRKKKRIHTQMIMLAHIGFVQFPSVSKHGDEKFMI